MNNVIYTNNKNILYRMNFIRGWYDIIYTIILRKPESIVSVPYLGSYLNTPS